MEWECFNCGVKTNILVGTYEGGFSNLQPLCGPCWDMLSLQRISIAFLKGPEVFCYFVGIGWFDKKGVKVGGN
jgi:hypothetical protein